VTVRTFLRVLGFVYFIAFTSFGIQAMGLIGSKGILPIGEYFEAVRATLSTSAWWKVPSVLWLGWSDGAVRAVWILGAILAALAVVGRRQKLALAGCLVLWLSVCSAGQDFLSFQWDILLVEAGFLALFADCSAVRVWLFRWLLFRLMFFSGVVKLLSEDPTWRGLTALSFHYETQPLPTPVAWYLNQLPMGFQKASTALVFVAELLIPFLFLGPRRLRHVAGYITIGLQALIICSGNYTFFNILTIALTMWLFIEVKYREADGTNSPSGTPSHRPRLHRVVSALVATFVFGISGLLCLETFSALPPGGAAILRAVEPLHLVSSYGLFAQMTTTRPEIVVEGSTDGDNWRAYEFRYKPGDLLRAPPVVAPHQPRLDWQMWFAALGNYEQNPWFVNFCARLLQGSPEVLSLLQNNPFPNAPPRYIRAQVYDYHFSTPEERRAEGVWWHRELKGDYLPAFSLSDLR
jgi:hypothetical protein